MKGGDTPALDAKMERCVADLVDQGYDKVAAIKICKTSISGKKKTTPKRKGPAAHQRGAMFGGKQAPPFKKKGS